MATGGMASFSLSPVLPFWVMLIQLGLYGGANSIQFTAMNTVTLRDLDAAGAGSGNSLFSMVQMLSMSLGVTVAGALLAAFSAYFGRTAPVDMLAAFRATFLCIGLITCASAWIFWQLSPDIRGGASRTEPGDTG